MRKSSCLWRYALAFTALGFLSLAQAQMPARFDAVSVKPADPNVHAFGMRYDPVHLTYPWTSLYGLILDAYDLDSFQVIGGRDWVRHETFMLDAVTSSPTSKTDMMIMLRQALADQFHLQLRQTLRHGNVYRLIVAKGGAKVGHEPPDPTQPKNIGTFTPPLADPNALNPIVIARQHLYKTDDRGTSTASSSEILTSPRTTVSELAASIGGILNAPVIDATGITGVFAITLHYAGTEPDADPGQPRLTAALKEQLGLELVQSKGSYPVFTIVGAEHPAGN